MPRKPRSDDDENYPPEGGCIGTGSVHDLNFNKPAKKPAQRPIGFVIFQDKPEPKKRKPAAAKKQKPKRRKR